MLCSPSLLHFRNGFAFGQAGDQSKLVTAGTARREMEREGFDDRYAFYDVIRQVSLKVPGACLLI